MNKIIMLLICISSSFVYSQTSSKINTYLNQEPPGIKPKIFAPGIISTKTEYQFGSAFSKNADKFFFAVRLNKEWKAEIRYTELKNGKWTKPARLDLDPKYSYNDPLLSDDETRLYFISDLPYENQRNKNINLWYIEKSDTGWSEPKFVSENVNSSKDEFYISFSDKGTIFFASNVHTKSEKDKWNFDIYYSEFKNKIFQPPVSLSKAINTTHFECDAFIAPDESYMIFCSIRPEGFGEGDLYISFKTAEGNWTEAKNMGNLINSSHHEFCPFVTKDGKYFFYTSNGNIYWMEARSLRDYFRKE